MSDGYRTKQAELAGDGFRIIRVADVKEGRVALDGPDFVSADFQKQIGLKQAAVGDVLLTTKGTVGRVAVVPDGIGRAVYSPQLCWFRIADARILQPRYLSYWLQSGEFLSQSSHMQGNTDMAPYISLSDLRRTKIALRPHREQVSIAEVLGALDDKIAANISLSMTIASHLEADHARLTSNTTRMVSLADIVSTQYGVTTSATQGFDGPRLLRVTDINKHPWVDWETTPCCDITTAEQERYQLHSGDIVVARMADPGKAGWIETGDPTAVFASYLVRLRAKIGHHAPFIYQFLRSAEYAMYADGAMQGSVQRNMNAKVIVGTEIRLPTEEVLHLFAERFLKARAAMASALRENRTLAATRDALLPQLMSGKIRVRDAEAIAADAGA